MSKKATGKMGINLDNIISILATALYSRDDVALREILSNSTDSLTRKLARLSDDQMGAFQITITSDPHKGTLTILDTGVGMTKDEIEQHLAVIGSSGTKTIRSKIKDPTLLKQLIGQFGIGLLSAFTIAKRVEIETRSVEAGPQDPGFVWRCDGQDRYTLEEKELDLHGTRTKLFIKEDKMNVLSAEYIKKVVSTYCEFLPFPIYNKYKEQLNAIKAPWHKETDEQIVLGDYYGYLERRFEDKMDRPLSVHPLIYRNDRIDIGGILYIPNDPDYFNIQLAVDLYVRGVLVKLDCPQILPKWATFIGGIIDCSALSMVMSREDVMRGDNAFNEFKIILEDQILDFIKKIKQEQRTLRSVLLNYGNEIKMGCRLHKPFFDIIAEDILFQHGEQMTNLHRYTDIARRHEIKDFRDAIYYSTVKDVQSQIQLSRLYRQQNLDIINARSEIDEFIIEAYAKEHNLRTVNVDDEGASQFFTSETGEKWKILEEIFQLSDYPPFIPRISHFKPTDVPAILIKQDLGAKDKKILKKYLDEETLPDDLREFLDTVQDKDPKDTRILYINADNNVIQRLLKVADSDLTLAQITAHEIYHNSLQFSGESLDSHRLQHIYDYHNIFLDAAMSLHTDNIELRDQIENSVSPDETTAPGNGCGTMENFYSVIPGYNSKPRQVFVMMPFRNEHDWIYEDLESVCSELDLTIVRLDQIDVRERITDSIFEKIRESGVLFGILLDNNPNVMYELGLAHAYGKAWQTILLSNDSKQIPFDLKDYQVSNIPEAPKDVRGSYEKWKNIAKNIVEKVESNSFITAD
jgi:molecular chaperone HtpG